MRATPRLHAAALAMVAGLASLAAPRPAAGIALSGYLCPTCPSVTDPAALLGSLHPAYTNVNVAFAGFDAAGNATNLFDTKTWALTPEAVRQLQQQNRTVMLSVGGGDGAVLGCASPMPSFADTLSASLLRLVKRYGFDGIDWDIEHRSGDMEACGKIITAVIGGLKAGAPRLLVYARGSPPADRAAAAGRRWRASRLAPR